MAEVNQELYCGWANAECAAKDSSYFAPDADSTQSPSAEADSSSEMGTQSSSSEATSSNSRRLLRQDSGSVGVQELRDGSRILAKVREGRRTLAMDTSFLFQQQGLFFPYTAAGRGPQNASAEDRPLWSAFGGDVVQIDANRLQSSTIPARALLQDSSSTPVSSSNSSNSKRQIIQYPSLVVDWGATRTRPSSADQPPALDLTLWLNESQTEVRVWECEQLISPREYRKMSDRAYSYVT